MKRLEIFDVYEIPVSDIYYDTEFNCRGSFTPQSVHDLSQSIEQSGLQFPLVVQPYEKDGCKYRLLAGHRRFRAVTVFLKWETVPATIRQDLTEYESRVLNLTENLERKDLNILEEAKAIQNLYPNGESLRVIAHDLKRPTRWVHIRLRLLKFPEQVQKWAAAGLLSTGNIEALCLLDDEEVQIREAKKIVVYKTEHGKNAYCQHYVTSRFRPRKSKQQISGMIARLYNAGGDGLATRVLAWAAGHLSDEEIDKDILEFIDTHELTPRAFPEQLLVRRQRLKKKKTPTSDNREKTVPTKKRGRPKKVGRGPRKHSKKKPGRPPKKKNIGRPLKKKPRGRPKKNKKDWLLKL